MQSDHDRRIFSSDIRRYYSLKPVKYKKLIPTGRSISSVIQSGSNPNECNAVSILVLKKSKYLNVLRIPMLSKILIVLIIFCFFRLPSARSMRSPLTKQKELVSMIREKENVYPTSHKRYSLLLRQGSSAISNACLLTNIQ